MPLYPNSSLSAFLGSSTDVIRIFLHERRCYSGSARGGGGRDGGIFGGDDIGRLWTDNGQRVWIVVRGGGERMPFAVIFPLLHRFSLYSGGMGTGIGVR
ncbi:unnamed protein product [Ascophyllum nodosum]